MAMGGGTNLRLAESVSPPARPVRKASRHPPGILVAWMCSHLLELPSSRLDEELAVPPFHFLKTAPPRTCGPLARQTTLTIFVADYSRSAVLRVDPDPVI